jgi:streptogramin lyase
MYLAAARDGSLWFTEELGGYVERFDPATGRLTKYSLEAFSQQGLTLGPDGNIWVCNYLADAIARITPDGSITEFKLPGGGGKPLNIVAGPDGALWFTDETGKIGRITTSGTITEIGLPAGMQPNGIAAGRDGNLWFTETAADGTSKVGRLIPEGSYGEFALRRGIQGINIIAGPDGNLWLTTSRSGIVRLSPDGTVTELGGPAAQGIALGPDGNVWFSSMDSIGRITPAGVVTTYPIPATDSGGIRLNASAIAFTPDGHLWLVDFQHQHIGEVDISKLTTCSPPSPPPTNPAPPTGGRTAVTDTAPARAGATAVGMLASLPPSDSIRVDSSSAPWAGNSIPNDVSDVPSGGTLLAPAAPNGRPEKGARTFGRNGPKGAAHQMCLSPFQAMKDREASSSPDQGFPGREDGDGLISESADL